MADELPPEARLLDAFDDCLTRLQTGESISACLARHPALADELRPMLEATHAALAASRLPRHAQMRSRARFLAAVADRRKPVAAWRRALSPVMALAATFVIVWLAVAVVSNTALNVITPTPSPTVTPSPTASPSLTVTASPTSTRQATPTPSTTPTATTPAPSATSAPTLKVRPSQTSVFIQPVVTATPEPGNDNSNDNGNDNSNDNSGSDNGNDNDDNDNDDDDDNSGGGGSGGGGGGGGGDD